MSARVERFVMSTTLRARRFALALLVAALLVATSGAATARVRSASSVPGGGPPSVTGLLGDAVRLNPAGLPAATGEGLAALQELVVDPATQLLGIATFDGRQPPGGAQLGVLEALGLQVQPLQALPMAYVLGTKDQLVAAAGAGAVRDVYPNQLLEYDSTESTAATGALAVHQLGITGEGVGIAILDTGVDATHPALADHVTHNVKLLSPEYLSLVGLPVGPDVPPGTIVVPVDQLPYNNSDTLSGHGTHVAGIAAADASNNAELVGMAPDADIIGLSAGEALFITNAVAGLDFALLHHDDWNIDVINNSWGSSFAPFDPANPVNVATKALHDAGVVVVFAAGNSTDDMQINPYSVAPWVISVAATTNTKERADFTSGGLPFDNSVAGPMPADRHQRYEGDGLGLYHPDVAAPGVDVLSTGTPTGVGILAPSAPGGTATISGTSMASPHVAGLVALLLEANPVLTPDQVAAILQATAEPLPDGTPFWQAGHGFVDAEAAVAMAQTATPGEIDAALAARDAEVLAAREFSVRFTDVWSFDALPVTVGGLDSRQFAVEVPTGTEAIHASVTFPSTDLLGINQFEYSVTVRDAAGAVVAASAGASGASGHSEVFADLRGLTEVTFGTWTVEVAGQLGLSDPGIVLGKTVSVALAQLVAQEGGGGGGGGGPVFTPTHSLAFPFFPDKPEGLLPSPEACHFDTNLIPSGTFDPARPSIGACRAGIVGYATNYAADRPAVFTSIPLTETVIGGPATIGLHLVDTLQPVWSLAFASRASIDLDATLPDGTVVALASSEQDAQVGPTPVRGTYEVSVIPTALPTGSVLRLTLRFSGVYTSTMRLLYGGGPYADSGITLTFGTLT
ncbi:MAG: S8 family peptidase [Acidimicrobiales bacterium]